MALPRALLEFQWIIPIHPDRLVIDVSDTGSGWRTVTARSLTFSSGDAANIDRKYRVCRVAA